MVKSPVNTFISQFGLGLWSFCLSCAQGGIYVFQLMDHYTAVVSLVFLAFFEVIAVCWIFGKIWTKFCLDADVPFIPKTRLSFPLFH